MSNEAKNTLEAVLIGVLAITIRALYKDGIIDIVPALAGCVPLIWRAITLSRIRWGGKG